MVGYALLPTLWQEHRTRQQPFFKKHNLDSVRCKRGRTLYSSFCMKGESSLISSLYSLQKYKGKPLFIFLLEVVGKSSQLFISTFCRKQTRLTLCSITQCQLSTPLEVHPCRRGELSHLFARNRKVRALCLLKWSGKIPLSKSLQELIHYHHCLFAGQSMGELSTLYSLLYPLQEVEWESSLYSSLCRTRKALHSPFSFSTCL